MPHFREASALRSPRDSDDVSRVHIRLDAMSKQLVWLVENAKRLQYEIDHLRLRKGGQDESVTTPCPYA